VNFRQQIETAWLGILWSKVLTLVTMDVTSLYMNIPHNVGIAACRKIWEQRTVQEPPTEIKMLA
jgi:hypothetical protein